VTKGKSFWEGVGKRDAGKRRRTRNLGGNRWGGVRQDQRKCVPRNYVSSEKNRGWAGIRGYWGRGPSWEVSEAYKNGNNCLGHCRVRTGDSRGYPSQETAIGPAAPGTPAREPKEREGEVGSFGARGEHTLTLIKEITRWERPGV